MCGSSRYRMIQVTVSQRPLRVLDLDIENRPLSYRGDFPTADVTAIAASWVDDPQVYCWLVTPDPRSYRRMLTGFRAMYDRADWVTGHNLRKHDLGIINGAMVEFGLPPLEPRVAQDTLRDLTKTPGLPRDQESLCELFGIEAPKHHMNQHRWRVANRLRDTSQTETRVVGDVVQHKLLRAELLRRGLLKEPRRWAP